MSFLGRSLPVRRCATKFLDKKILSGTVAPPATIPCVVTLFTATLGVFVLQLLVDFIVTGANKGWYFYFSCDEDTVVQRG